MFGSSSTFGASSSFGSSTQSPFGAKPAGGLSFGTSSFGQPAAGSTGTGFGASSTGTSLFGSSTAAKPAFGSGATTFGAAPAAAPAFGKPATASPFGSTNTTGFGAAKPAFGAAPAPAATPFGAPAPAFGASSGTGLFGASKPSPFSATSTGSTFGFGAQSTQPTTGFGATSTASPFGAPAAASPFGAPATASSAFGATGSTSLFSSTPVPARFGAGGMFGAGAQTGTSTYNYTDIKEGNTNTRMMSITVMDQYKTKSFEELRCEDYAKGNKGGTAAAAPAAFGASTTPSPFGAPAPAASPFGATTASPFGATPAPAPAPGGFSFGAATPASGFGATATTPAFGATSTTPAFGATGTTGFGSTGFGATTGAAKPFSFGNTAAAPAASPFGATPGTTGTSLFGAQQSTPGFGQTATTGFSFGTTPAAAPAFGATAASSAFSFGGATKPVATGFGATTTPGFGFGATKPATGGFGSPGATSAFNFGATAPAPAAGGLFGSTTTPAFGSTGAASTFSFNNPAKPAGSLFGGAAAPATTSLFGQKPAGTLFGSPTGFGALPPAQPQTQLLVGAHNQNVYGVPGTALGSGQLAQKLDAVEARSSQLEIKLDPGSRPLRVTAKGNPEHTVEAGSVGASGLPSYKQASRGVARIKPRGMAGAAGGPATLALTASPALARLKSEGLSSSQVFSPDSYTGSTAKKLQIKPDAHKPRSMASNGVRSSVAGRIDFSSAAIEEGVEESKDATSNGPVMRGPVVLSDGCCAVGATPNKSPHADQQLQTPRSGPSPGHLPAPPSTGASQTTMPPSPEHTSLSSGNKNGPARPTPQRRAGVYTPALGFATQKENGTESPGAKEGQYHSYADFYHQIVKPPEASPEAISTPQSSSKDYPLCPRLTMPQYFTEPAYSDLQQMSDEELASLPGLTVGRFGFGKIHWDGMVDVRGLNFDKLIRIEDKEVAVYEDMEEEEKPAVGEELNRPAIITLYGIYPPENVDPTKYTQKIQKRTKKMDADFIDYNPSKGEWSFRTKHFSRYGLVDSDSDDDEETLSSTPQEKQPMPTKQLKPKPMGRQFGLHVSDEPKEEDHSVEPDITMFEAPVERPTASPFPERIGLNTEGVESLRMSMGPQGPSTTGFFSPDKLGFQESRGPSTASPWGRSSPPVDAMETVPTLALALPGAEQPQAHMATSVAPPKRKLRAFYPLSKSRTAQLLKEVADDLNVKLEGMAQGASFPKVRADYGLFMGRSFRVGWGPNGELIHPGRAVFGGSSTAKPFGTNHTLTVEKVNTVPSRISEKASAEEVSSHFLPLLQLHHFSATKSNKEESEYINIAGRETKVATQFFMPQVAPFVHGPTTDTVLSYRRWVACIHNFSKTVADPTQVVVTDAERVVSQAWALINALFGQETVEFDASSKGLMPVQVKDVTSQPMQPNMLRRKEMISTWLKEVVAPRVSTTEPEQAKGKEDLYQQVFKCLSAYRLSEAAAVARKGGCFRLASLITQASDPIVRDMILLQVQQWHDSRAVGQISPTLLKVYTVLSGNYAAFYRPMHAELAKLGQTLDWQRHLGLYLWYQAGPEEGIQKAVEDYVEAVEAGQAPRPLAWYLEGEGCGGGASKPELSASACVTYHLLRLFCAPNQAYPLTAVVDPRTMTQDLLDYRHSWRFLTLLRKLNMFPEEDGVLVSVTDSLVFQLLSCGLWEWACYCLTHLTDATVRTRRIREVLDRHSHGAEEEPAEYERKCTFLIDELELPSEWIQASRAQYLKAHSPEKPRLIAKCLMEAYEWEQAHALICARILPKTILRFRAKPTGAPFDAQVLSWLVELEGRLGRKQEELWVAPGGGAMYLAYARLLELRADLLAQLSQRGLTAQVVSLSQQFLILASSVLDQVSSWAPPTRFPHCLATQEEQQLEVVCRAEMTRSVFQLKLAMEAEQAEAENPEVQPMKLQSLAQFASCSAVLSDFRAQKLAQLRDDFIDNAIKQI